MGRWIKWGVEKEIGVGEQETAVGGAQGERNGSRELRDSGRHSRWREERPSAGRG